MWKRKERTERRQIEKERKEKKKEKKTCVGIQSCTIRNGKHEREIQ